MRLAPSEVDFIYIYFFISFASTADVLVWSICVWMCVVIFGRALSFPSLIPTVFSALFNQHLALFAPEQLLIRHTHAPSLSH